jgi:hypothetical protein
MFVPKFTSTQCDEYKQGFTNTAVYELPISILILHSIILMPVIQKLLFLQKGTDPLLCPSLSINLRIVGLVTWLGVQSFLLVIILLSIIWWFEIYRI